MAALNNQSRRKHCVILFLRCKTEVTPLRLPGQPNRGIPTSLLPPNFTEGFGKIIRQVCAEI